MAVVRAQSGQTIRPLDEGWELASTPPGACASPSALSASLEWIAASVPGTVAGSLRDAGRWQLASPAPLHDQDHWYRTTLSGDGPARLRLDGLATLAEVWLDDELILTSRSMFEGHEIALTLAGMHRLAICFRALAAWLSKPSKAGRWRARMIESSGLRHVRTTLLGHMPGWCPGVHAVGPWRLVALVVPSARAWRLAAVDVRARLEGDTGVLDATLAFEGEAPGVVDLHCAGRTVPLARGDDGRYRGSLSLPGVAPWWPHTLGTPALHQVTLAVGTDTIDLGRTGFRTIAVDRGADGQGFGLVVNGVPLFCRGAVWSPADLVTLTGERAPLLERLHLAREAGMSLLRVPGTGVYESQTFHDLCDELGLLVWQDVMLANLDYPAADETFQAALTREVDQLLARTQLSPSLAVMCGGSEVYQQAAMLGLPPKLYRSPLYAQLVVSLVAARRPDLVYVENSPEGGSLPFVVDAGVGHYFGVGAYRRPLDDARRANVRFAAECLAFANVPEPVTLERELPGIAPGHHPLWKQRVPRDAGAGWDFEDVRDHYLELLTGLRAADLRAVDPDRYLALSRATVAEVMEQTFAEWQRPGSSTRGALVLMLGDLWPGAGWGVIDSCGEPKSAFYALKRAFAPLRVTLTDEGVNGLAIHLANETGHARALTLRLTAYRDGTTAIVRAKRDIDLPARGALTLAAFDLVGGFFDLTCAYRFQPPQHDATHVALLDRASGAMVADAFHFPTPLPSAPRALALTATAGRDDAGAFVTVACDRVARFVSIDDRLHRPDDNWFHLAPNTPRTIRLHPRRRTDTTSLAQAGEVGALNALTPARYEAMP